MKITYNSTDIRPQEFSLEVARVLTPRVDLEGPGGQVFTYSVAPGVKLELVSATPTLRVVRAHDGQRLRGRFRLVRLEVETSQLEVEHLASHVLNFGFADIYGNAPRLVELYKLQQYVNAICALAAQRDEQLQGNLEVREGAMHLQLPQSDDATTDATAYVVGGDHSPIFLPEGRVQTPYKVMAAVPILLDGEVDADVSIYGHVVGLDVREGRPVVVIQPTIIEGSLREILGRWSSHILAGDPPSKVIPRPSNTKLTLENPASMVSAMVSAFADWLDLRLRRPTNEGRPQLSVPLLGDQITIEGTPSGLAVTSVR